MTREHESMKEVRKNFKVAWYRCALEQAKLKELTTRNDAQGLFQTICHIALVLITGTLTYIFFNQRIWIGFAIALFAHGTIYSFIAGLATHELAHGTVFKSKWLAAFFLRFLSIISWMNFHNYKMSHTYHHLYTLYPRGDRELVLPIKPTLHPLHMLQLFTFNIGGGKEPWSWPIVPVVGATIKLAFTGKFDKQWLEDIYEDQAAARRKAVNWARMILLFNIAVIVVSVAFKLWMLPVLVVFAPFIANWWRYFVGAPMHTGLKDQVNDFRLSTRTITVDPFSEFLTWRMTWHIEHHMFAAVPCYNLKALYEATASDMPEPRTLIGAWKEMRLAWKKQKEDPGDQFETPLPKPKADVKKVKGSLEESIGDLSPVDLD